MKRRFLISADKRASEEAKIKAILQGNFRDALSKSRELEQRRTWLASNLAAYAVLPDQQLDVVGAAKGFGLGALAVAHPLIGVPALIGNWFSGEEKRKSIAARDEQFESTFRDYIEGLEVLRSLLLKGQEQTQRYVTTKWREVNQEGVMTMAKVASEAGLDISHFPSEEERRGLKELEEMFEVKEEGE